MSKHQALDTFGRSGNPVFGNKFDGEYKDGKRNGQGTWTSADGDK